MKICFIFSSRLSDFTFSFLQNSFSSLIQILKVGWLCLLLIRMEICVYL